MATARTGIKAREREAIVRALTSAPDDIEAIADKFGRSPYTIRRIKQASGVICAPRRLQLSNKLKGQSSFRPCAAE
jgi:hypothetical protein